MTVRSTGPGPTVQLAVRWWARPFVAFIGMWRVLTRRSGKMFKFNTQARRPLTLDDALPVEASADGKPKWNKLFPLGVTKYRQDMPGGKLCFDKAFCSELVANAKAILAKGHRIQGNYHHFGGDDVDPRTPLENTIASGWLQDVELRQDGVYGLIDWTEKARVFIDAKELQYLSPEFYLSWMNRDTGKPQGPTLVGFALTNTPFLKELPPVAASEQHPTQADPSAATGAKRMEKKLLCALLGLSEDAADDVIQAKLKELNAAALKLAEQEKAALKLKESQAASAAEITTLREAAVKLTERVTEVEKQNAALLSERKTSEVKAFFDGLIKAGKIIPASREGFEKLALSNGLEAVKFLDTLPTVVTAPGAETGVSSGVPADQATAMKKLGELAAQMVKEQPDLKLSDAKIRVMEKNPELAAQLVQDSPKRDARA